MTVKKLLELLGECSPVADRPYKLVDRSYAQDRSKQMSDTMVGRYEKNE